MNLLNSSSSSSSSDGEDPLLFLRNRKLHRVRKNRFDNYDDEDFFDKFRLKKATALFVFELIKDMIRLPTNRGGSIPPLTQFLLTLRFYATGSFFIVIEDFMGVSKSVFRIIKRVSEAIATLRPRFINMYDNEQDMARSAAEFYELARFPRVIGAIGCTLIKIESPDGEDAEIFRSRKGYFALNVQTISDASLKIRNIVARWPGSVPDETIFNNSRVKRDFQNGKFGKFMLIGDSGYSVQPYLMTKLQESNTPAENLYNESAIRTRNVVERQYGVWKRRFPILSTGIRLKSETAMTVVVATAVLHNIAVEMYDNIPDDWFEGAEEREPENRENLPVDPGRNIRQLIINEHFSKLL